IDDLFVSVRRSVGEEVSQLFAGRRQPDQVEVDSAQERRSIGLGVGLKAGALVLRGDEMIDGIPRPSRPGKRQGGTNRPAKGPVRARIGLGAITAWRRGPGGD